MIGSIKSLGVKSVRNAIRTLGADIQKYDPSTPVQKLLKSLRNVRDYVETSTDRDVALFLERCGQHVGISKSQIFQDVFALQETNGKVEGFFVEFGATDGKRLSNTHMLEKHFSWRGILAEPAKVWHDRLRANRNCIIDTRCVWAKSDQTLEFNETPDPELSTVDAFSDHDSRAAERSLGKRYSVATVSLNDLLLEHHAPRVIDYMSVDTEGSELSILEAFDFTKYEVRTLTVEHNYTPQRERIHDLLASRGYARKLTELSSWDDWYVKL